MLPAAPLGEPTLLRSAAVEHWARGAGPVIAVVDGAGAGSGVGAAEDAGADGGADAGRDDDGDDGTAAGVVAGTRLGAAWAEAPADSRLAPGWLSAWGRLAGVLQAAVSTPAHRVAAAALASLTGMGSRSGDAKSVIGAAF